MATSWFDVLDTYGRALLDFENQLESGDAVHTTFNFELPTDLGPLPPQLADVAKNVAELSSRVEDRVREAMAQTAHDQVAVTRARALEPRERPAARFVDVSG